MSDYKNDYEKQGMYVRVKNNDVNKALRKLKKMMNAEGIFQELRMREFYEPPSIRKKREKAQAVKRWKKKQEDLSKNS